MLKEYHVVQAVVVSYRQAGHAPVEYFQRWFVQGPVSAESTTNTGEENPMNAVKITGIILIVIGLAGFFTGGFSFTKDTTAAKIGPIELKVQEKESVNIPQWLSLGALALGAIVLVAGFRKS